MATDYSDYIVDLDTEQSNGKKGDTPFTAFTKYNSFVSELQKFGKGVYIGTSAPSTTFAYQLWVDTSDEGYTLKRRGSGNGSWIVVGDYTQTLATAAGLEAALIPTTGEVPVADSDGYLDSSLVDYSKVTLPTPDLDIPLIDSLKIKYGYGNPDTITIGSNTINLPTKSIDFTRNSSSWIVNPSNYLTEVAANEGAINSEGLWLHEGYTNYSLYSTAFYTNVENNYNTTMELNEDDSPFEGGNCTELTEDSSSGEHFVVMASITATTGSYYHSSVYVKPNTNVGGRYLNLRFADSGSSILVEDDGSLSTTSDSVTVEELYDGWYRISRLWESTVTGAVSVRLQFTDSGDSTYVGDNYSSFLIHGIQVTGERYTLPLVYTEDTSVTIPATSTTLPIENNFPATGTSFTIMFDSPVGLGTSNRTIFSRTGSTDTGLVFNSTPSIIFRAGTNGGGDYNLGTVSTSGLYEEGSMNRYVVVCDLDNNTLSSYINGGLLGSQTITGEMTTPYDGTLVLGSSASTWYLNSQIKNFKIYHKALSADQIVCLGSA